MFSLRSSKSTNSPMPRSMNVRTPLPAPSWQRAWTTRSRMSRSCAATFPLRGRSSQGRPPSHPCSRGSRQGNERAVRRAHSVEAARTASAVRGDQDHEDHDHCHRQTYSQPRLPVPRGPSVVPARVVHLEPPFGPLPSPRGCTHGTTSVVTASHHPLSRQTRLTPRRPPPTRDVSHAVSPRSAFLSCSYPRPRGHRPTYSGAGPAWRTPTSSRWRRRSAGSS
jgi:hypothetical protein